ncbi:MAG TPA: glycosyltransferase family 4 protein [Dehalococcoidia bacterium]|nr:glycosyltransferase family 4 protein [Dehalococcoidia bacterium]
MPRVGIVTYDFFPPIGGQGRHTYELWWHLRRLGADVKVLSSRPNALAGHTCAGTPAAMLARGIGFSIHANVVLSRWLHANPCDLLHLNGGPGGVLLLVKPPAPLLYTAHHTYAQQARLVPGQAWKKALAQVEARGYAAAAAVAADTPSTARSVIAELGVDAAKVTVIPSGFDASRFRPLGLERAPDWALFVGRLDARKGFRFLLESWVEVARRRPQARLFVVGSGPLEPWARRFVAQHCLEASVRFLGRQSEDGLISWYNRVSVVVVPSVFEGFGLTALEALACGAQVVASDVEGLADVVPDAGWARRVPYGDNRALAEGILGALQAPKAIPAAAIARLAQTYSWPQVAAMYLAAYQSLESQPS